MPTASGHTTAIRASKVKGTTVYTSTGEKIGYVEDVVLCKQANQVMFAALGIDGFMGLGEQYVPVPWSYLDCNKEKDGYVLPLTGDDLRAAPNFSMKDLVKEDGTLAGVRDVCYDHYKVARDYV